jgi:hypothetical protein
MELISKSVIPRRQGILALFICACNIHFSPKLVKGSLQEELNTTLEKAAK